MAQQPGSPAGRRRAGRRGAGPGRLSVLAVRDFRVFFAGYSTSLLGSAMADIALTFAGTFVGEKNVYLEAKGAISSSGWAKKGTWMPVSAGPPKHRRNSRSRQSQRGPGAADDLLAAGPV